MFNMVPDMRDGAEKLDVDDDDSEDLEPTERDVLVSDVQGVLSAHGPGLG